MRRAQTDINRLILGYNNWYEKDRFDTIYWQAKVQAGDFQFNLFIFWIPIWFQCKRMFRNKSSQSFQTFIIAMVKLTRDKKSRAIGLLAAGKSVAQIAWIFSGESRTMKRLWEKFLDTGDVIDLPRSGRPSKLFERQSRGIVTSHRRKRFKAVSTTYSIYAGPNTVMQPHSRRNYPLLKLSRWFITCFHIILDFLKR